MDRTDLKTIAQWAHGRLAAGNAAVSVETICTDSRKLQPADLFLALRGENFDGHAFVAAAAQRGATGAVVEKAPDGLPENFAIIEVNDTQSALQQIAGTYRPRTFPSGRRDHWQQWENEHQGSDRRGARRTLPGHANRRESQQPHRPAR
jgi:UDP-N-acetylmuramyl pentapeptide synthase